MAETLEQLATQGDPGTLASEEQASRIKLLDPQQLYELWEKQHWLSHEIDFSRDKAQWDAMNDEERDYFTWGMSAFFIGEERVTTQFSGLVMAYEDESEEAYLTTQQVDEARHAVLFHRFFKEVLGIEGDVGKTLEATLPQLNWGYRGVFDRLDRMADELRADRSLPKFAQAITLYHLIVEGTLAQPGQHFIEDFFTRDGGMPGFSAGMVNVSRDEQRHIGFGVKTLSEIVPQSEECKAAIVDLFREVNRYSIGVFCPPGFDRAYTECWGFTMEDIYAFGLKLVRQRWKTIGFPLHEMPDDVWPFDHSMSDEEIAARQVRLLLAGVTGAPNASPDSSPEVQELLFDMTARRANTSKAGGGPFRVQWQFADAAPWHVIVDNGSTRAQIGEIPEPHVTLTTTWPEWVGIALNDRNPLRAIVERRLSAKGSPRALGTFRKVFPPV